MVLKTGPDRPVQPGTGVQSGPILLKNRKSGKSDQKPKTAGSTMKTANRHRFEALSLSVTRFGRLAVNGGERKIALLGGRTTKEVNDGVPGVELGPRCGEDWISLLSRSLLSFLSLYSVSFSGRGNQELQTVVGWVDSSPSPATFGCLRNPLEVLDLNLSFLLSCSTTVVRMGL
uniref:Uncharacterized protein n=1 Tax=Fagus sylvatica TaxID=28930 RepID=A0A2N9G3T0_FAGSY